MAGGARPARVSHIEEFPLSDLTVAVLQVEGTVQMVYRALGWPGGPMKAMANQFCGPETAGQLRALADHLEKLPWESPI